ncbi:hypothetical protein AQI88_14290 [Streptomyces cellostaticus]|uniref:Uncharacterized protein n=1 Tax=Streptomyces cellostaticus TaxID=67285 RepID=A0A117PWX6_9ACTN|nr:hypothetical protein [Streptomyces cellostaticus]KUM95943.1 hypothetical protein AQI88_14290 [Streptomyces cellostaticus]GHI02518.1 hypothetical protein Scel_08390 [Streptomyces cellostaticus]
MSPSSKYPYLSAGCNNTREWNRTATAAAPDGTLRVAWPASDGMSDKVVGAHLTGDIAVSKGGALTWAYAAVTPSYGTKLTGASPTTTSLRIARLTP